MYPHELSYVCFVRLELAHSSYASLTDTDDVLNDLNK